MRVRERTALLGTLFRFAQYFGWTEILYRSFDRLRFERDKSTKSNCRCTEKHRKDVGGGPTRQSGSVRRHDDAANDLARGTASHRRGHTQWRRSTSLHELRFVRAGVRLPLRNMVRDFRVLMSGHQCTHHWSPPPGVAHRPGTTCTPPGPARTSPRCGGWGWTRPRPARGRTTSAFSPIWMPGGCCSPPRAATPAPSPASPPTWPATVATRSRSPRRART